MGLLARRRATDTALDASGLGEATGIDVAHVPAPAGPTPAEQRDSRRLEDAETVMRVAPRKGWPQPFAGRCASLPRTEVVRADTGNAAGAYPFLHAGSLPPVGAYIGHNTLTTQAFSAHPRSGSAKASAPTRT